MNLITTKIVVAILFAALRFFFGILPIKLYKFLRSWDEELNTSLHQKRHEQVTKGVILCQSFGGGTLFATVFLYMAKGLFYSTEDVKYFYGITLDYPFSQLVLCYGFFATYFVEEFAHWWLTKNYDKLFTLKVVERMTTTRKSADISSEYRCELIESLKSNRGNKRLNSIDEESNQSIADSGLDTEITIATETKLSSFRRKDSLSDSDSEINEVKPAPKRERRLDSILAEVQINYEHIKATAIENKYKSQLVHSILTVAALTVHLILEGASIGLRKRRVEIWYLFIAVNVYSFSILFCIGLELFLAKTRLRFIFIQVTILALAAPFGIALGTIATLDENKAETIAIAVTTVIMEGLSAGAILYITFFEILNREKERRCFRIRRGLSLLTGFTVMVLLQYLEAIVDLTKIAHVTIKSFNVTYCNNCNQ